MSGHHHSNKQPTSGQPCHTKPSDHRPSTHGWCLPPTPRHTLQGGSRNRCVECGLRLRALRSTAMWADSYGHISTIRHLYSAIHVGTGWKMWDRRQIKNRHYKNLRKAAQKNQTQNTAKQNYLGSVAFYATRPGNEVGLFYKAHEPTQGMLPSTSGFEFHSAVFSKCFKTGDFHVKAHQFSQSSLLLNSC